MMLATTCWIAIDGNMLFRDYRVVDGNLLATNSILFQHYLLSWVICLDQSQLVD